MHIVLDVSIVENLICSKEIAHSLTLNSPHFDQRIKALKFVHCVSFRLRQLTKGANLSKY